jgi:hypothetical protein
MKLEYVDINGNVWQINRSDVVRDMHNWAAGEPSGSFGNCIFTEDVLQWVNDNTLSIKGWVLVDRLVTEPDLPCSKGVYLA